MAKMKTASKLKIDGLPVKNLAKPITLEITEQDCKRGNVREPGSCAAALAAIHGVPNCTEARVHLGRVYLKIGTRHWLRGKTTGALRTEIAAFDKGGNFEPGSYTIAPLSGSELKALKHSGGRNAHKKSTKKRGSVHFVKGVRSSGHCEYTRIATRKKGLMASPK